MEMTRDEFILLFSCCIAGIHEYRCDLHHWICYLAKLEIQHCCKLLQLHEILMYASMNKSIKLQSCVLIFWAFQDLKIAYA